MPTCELVTIGSELLNGSTLNTNAQFLARRVSALDIDVIYQTSCRDQEQEILDTLTRAFERSDLIFVTGGLGPTPDDITREAIAKFFGCGLKFHPRQHQHVLRYFKKIKKHPPIITRREAFFPEMAKPLLNRFGIALGFYVHQSGRLLIALPGVPRELVGMYEASVERLIQRVFKNRMPNYMLEARIVGLSEPQIMKKLGNDFFKGRRFDFGIYPEIGQVTIRLKTKEKKLISVLRNDLIKKMSDSIFSFSGDRLETVIGRLLLAQRKTISIAESCTGGLLSKRITDSSGASRYFKGGLVAYSNEIKRKQLGVPERLLREKGAVSKETARWLARSVRMNYKTSIGISVTGIAGPGGGTRKKPVGLVYIALADSKRISALEFRFLGDRDTIRIRSTQKALELLWRWLKTK